MLGGYHSNKSILASYHSFCVKYMYTIYNNYWFMLVKEKILPTRKKTHLPYKDSPPPPPAQYDKE